MCPCTNSPTPADRSIRFVDPINHTPHATALLTVQLPLLLIISNRLGEHKWARLSHYVRR